MTKKHFLDLVKRLANLRPDPKTGEDYPARMAQWRLTVQEMADFCQVHGPNFNRYAFMVALGME